MRGLLLLCLLAPALAADDPWVKLDRDEFQRLFREIAEQKDPRWKTQAVELQRLFDAGKWNPYSGAKQEVHGVSLIHGDPPAGQGDRSGRPPTVARVKVTRTGCDVVLVLCSGQPIEWRVEMADGVRLGKVLLSGAPKSVVRGLGEAKRVQDIGRVFAFQRQAGQFAQLQAAVAPRVGGQRIDTYVGKAHPEGRTLVVGPGGADWQRQMVLARMRELHRASLRDARAARLKTLRRYVFPAVVWHERGRRVFCDCTVGGPIADTFSPVPGPAFTAAVDPDTGHRYFLSTQGIEEQDRDGDRVAQFEFPPWMGPRSWVASLAFDARRRRLLLAGMGGSLAAYHPDTRSWEPIVAPPRMQGGRLVIQGNEGWLSAITYDAGRDSIWALRSNGARATLVRHDPFGKPVARKILKLPVRIQPGGRNGTVLAAVGDHLALLAVNWSGRQRKANRALVIDPSKGSVFLDVPLETLERLDPPPREDWPALWESLSGHDPYSAIRLCARGRAPLVAYLRDRWEKLPRIEEALVDRALEDLGASDPVVRSDAFAILSGGSPRLVARLEKEVLQRDSPEVRLAITRLLAQYRSEPDVRTRLLQVLADNDAPGAATLRARLAARGE